MNNKLLLVWFQYVISSILFDRILYVGRNRRLVLNEVKPNVYRGIFQKQSSDNSVLFDYCHPLEQALADWFYAACWASLRLAPTYARANLRPARRLTSIKAPINHQTRLGPTLAMFSPIKAVAALIFPP
ncbi:hypothetical protein JD499_01185 [Aeromonas enteropelogenes]|nr:hypothetical protein [Aeromonas enteropelogenes]